ncbi:hypothetical protein ACIBHX_46970 [Nonomuraea sp. NPDC050536]|uniref:hypothetical protein n=1 Tax=Nonomuraea sp. NPDC050536 TaxID=3364366 RepID=UPI0037C58CE7
MGVMRGPDGMEVKAIVLDHRPLLSVSRRSCHRRYHLGYCSSVEEFVARFKVDLAELEYVERRRLTLVSDQP